MREELAGESVVEGGREDLPERERTEPVDSALDVRRETSGDSGAGRLEIRESREHRELGVRG